MELRMEERNKLPIKKPCWAAIIWYGAVQIISDIESSKTKTTIWIFPSWTYQFLNLEKSLLGVWRGLPWMLHMNPRYCATPKLHSY